MTEISSSPSLVTMMSYSASSSVVASWAVGLAESDTETAAVASGDMIVNSSKAVSTEADGLRFIATPTQPPL